MPEASPSAAHVFLGMTAIIASEPMQRLMEVVQRVARSSATTLITGESGVGKELVARAVHNYSATSAERLAEQIRPSQGCSSWLIRGPSSWTKSASWTAACK